MGMQKYVNQEIKSARASSFARSNQITLGELIDQLYDVVEKNKDRVAEGKPEAEVVFDFEYLFPTTLDSWRGSYMELAIGFSNYESNKKPMGVGAFYKMLQDAVGAEYEGYKGGEFVMSRETPIWVANYGNSGNTGVVGIRDNGYSVIILTAYCEY